MDDISLLQPASVPHFIENVSFKGIFKKNQIQFRLIGKY